MHAIYSANRWSHEHFTKYPSTAFYIINYAHRVPIHSIKYLNKELVLYETSELGLLFQQMDVVFNYLCCPEWNALSHLWNM